MATLTRELIKQCFEDGAKIRARLRGGYKIRTRTGGSVIVKADRFKDLQGGSDIYEGVARLGKALGWPGVAIEGSVEQIAHMMQAGQLVGQPVSAAETKHFFGLIKDPPPALPQPSGVNGSQGLSWTDADLKAAGLLGAPNGAGIRVGASLQSGQPLLYAGPDAENSITGFGPPGSGKGVCFQISASLDFNGSQVVIDPSGQLFASCAAELKRRGVRVIPIMPFANGFPSEIAELVRHTRCLNPMDALDPTDEGFASDCGELAQMLKREEKGTQEDSFFTLSGRNLIRMLTGCVKLYSHPSEQNLCEVYHKLGDVFEYARSIITKPDMPRFISTQLKRWTVPGAAQDKTLRSIVETALAELSWLGDDAIENAIGFSSFAWEDLKNGPRPVAVFILLPVNKLESHKPFLTLCAGAALMGLGRSERGRHRVLLTVDEAALLGHMPMLQRAFAESRKRGVQLSVWFQNIHQAEAIYGPAWRNMLSGSDLQIHLRPRDLPSAEFIAKQMGTYSEIIPHFSYAPGRGGQTRESVSFGEQGRPVMFPQEVMALPQGQAIMFAPGRSKNALVIWARPWFDSPDLKSRGGVDPYHRHRSGGGNGNA
jgi:type IV secretion system protein VirD4